MQKYQQYYVESYASLMRAKLGLYEVRKEDQALCTELLELMHENQVDYTLMFRYLSQLQNKDQQNKVRDLFLNRQACDQWMQKYKQRLEAENINDIDRSHLMKQVNPKFILRNYMAEIAIKKATQDGDYSEIDILLKLLQNPFDEHDDLYHYAGHPPDWAQQISVSCSS